MTHTASLSALALVASISCWQPGRQRRTRGDLARLYERLDAIFDGIEALVGGFRPSDLVVIEKALSHNAGPYGEILANCHNVAGALTRRGVTVIPLAWCSIEPAPLPATHLSVDKLFESSPVR